MLIHSIYYHYVKSKRKEESCGKKDREEGKKHIKVNFYFNLPLKIRLKY